MIEALMLFVGGLLGSAHCVGMCGAFVLTLGSTQRSWSANAVRQLAYSAGRISVYVFGGAVAGFAGWKLGRDMPALVNAQAILAIVAGGLLILEGAFSAGLLRRPGTGVGGCAAASSFAAMLRAPRLGSVVAAGVLNGFLPCGLVYAYLALAAAAGSVHQGALVMLLFGIGTVPALLMAGLSGTLVSVAARRRLFLVAAWCMMATGGMSIARGATFLQTQPAPEGKAPTCPYCAENASP